MELPFEAMTSVNVGFSSANAIGQGLYLTGSGSHTVRKVNGGIDGGVGSAPMGAYVPAQGLTARHTTSFSAIHNDIVISTYNPMNATYNAVATLSEDDFDPDERPDIPSIGELVPVGDALIPLMLCVAGYLLYVRRKLRHN